MIIPNIQGTLSHSNFFIFTAADSVYFDRHGIPLINSILTNTNYSIHIHIYNPKREQIQFCLSNERISVSYEYISPADFNSVTKQWLLKTSFDNVRQKQMYDKGQQSGILFLHDLITKTYYACVRFIRLNQLLSEATPCLAIDVDGLVRANFNYAISDEVDFLLYQKRNNEHLAGAMLFNKNSKPFLTQYASELQQAIENDDLYWFLDQLVLDRIVPNYKKGLLPVSYIDWEMSPNSSIWTAKGKRKELDIFKNEQKKYNV